MGRTITQEKVAVLRESYYRITGNVTEAMILNQMIYWSKRISDYDKFIGEENSRRKTQGKDKISLAFGWIHKTAAELKDEIMSDASLKTIARKLDDLVGKGFLDRRNNPDYSYDRTYQYRVNLLKVFDELNKLGYQLEGFKIDTTENNSSDDNNSDTMSQSDDECIRSDKTNSPSDNSNSHSVPSICHCDKWKRHGDEAIPEITTEITADTSSSSCPSKNENLPQAKIDDEDKKGEVSHFIGSMGLDRLAHRDMAEPIRELIEDLLLTGKVGKKRYSQAEIKKLLGKLSPSDIDNIIDRYSETAARGEIRNADNFLKVCLFSQGKANSLKNLAGKSGTDGIYCGKPSFDVEEYVKLSMENIMRE